MVTDAEVPGRLFVGRERELEELSSGLADAQAGRGRLFLLVGEAGIGKTRLADELARRAVAGGARVLWGRCWEGGGAPAYWPSTQVLRAYVRETPVDVALAEMGAGALDLAQISPILRAQLGAAAGDQPDQARFGLFDSLTSFLHAAAAARPLVLVLDDLHAADEASLRLLQFVARELRSAALLVVGTYREADLRRAPALLTIVADLVREGPRLALRGLSSAEVGHFLAGAATPPRDDLVTAIHKATGGNPFFVTEVARLWLADGTARQENPDAGAFQVPEEVREAIRRRLLPLSPNAATLLAVAAVIGREFDAGLLKRALALGDSFDEPLAEAAASGLIEEGPPGRYAFAHALVRQTLYVDQSPSRRVTLHAAVAAALEAECCDDPDPHLTDLAHHFYHAAASGVAEQAVLYTTRAAEQAMRRLAYEEASAQYERALQALQLRHGEPVDGVGDTLARAELLLALGHAQRRSGTQAVWRPTYRRAAAAARAAMGTPRAAEAARLLAGAALGSGSSSETGNVDEALLDMLREALDSLGDTEPVLRARLLARQAMALYFSPDSARGEALSLEALELARATGDVATELRCLVARHFALWRPDHLDERARVAGQIVHLGDLAREPEIVLEGRLWRLVAELERGDGEAVSREIDAFARAAGAVRHPIYRWHAELHRAMRALADGRLAEAEQISHAALLYGERAGLENPRQAFGVHVFWIRHEQGRLAELDRDLHALAERFPLPVWRCGLALLYAETGRTEDAGLALEPLAAEDFAALPVDGNWLPAMAVLAQVCVAVADRACGRRLYDRLLPYAGRVVVIAQAHACLGAVAYYLGLLAALDERWGEAAAHLDDALHAAEAVGGALLVAYAQCALASVLRVSAPGSPRTVALHAAAEAAAQRLGTARLAAQVRALGSPHPDAATPEPSPARTAMPAVFRKDAQYWTVAFDGAESRLKHSRGLAYLAELLRHPDRELHTLDLATRHRGDAGDETDTLAPGDDAGAMLDPAAKAAYREHLEQMRAEVEEATALNDLGRAERAREEMEVLMQQLAGAVGLGNRDRKIHSNAERSRVAVTKAVTLALRTIADANPSLRRYLAGTIKTGQFCSYTPDPRFPVRWRLE